MEIGYKLTEKGCRDYLLIKEALANNNQAAFSEIMDLYWDTIYFLLLKMTSNREDAEDLTIESFGKAFANLSQYTPDYAFSTWLFRIASNHCIDFIRKKKKNVLKNEGNEVVDNTDSTESIPREEVWGPEEPMIRNQKVMVVRQVLKKLKPRYQNLIQLRYFDELSYEEISNKLDLPLGTVKAQLFRARELLYQILKESREEY
jgi:RNA polymerase sigma factor (sigma-70 family)